jgi:hypothetical protein
MLRSYATCEHAATHIVAHTCVGPTDTEHVASKRPSNSKQDKGLATDRPLAYEKARSITRHRFRCKPLLCLLKPNASVNSKCVAHCLQATVWVDPKGLQATGRESQLKTSKS